MRALDTKKLPMDELPWVRAHAISGNGEVVLGTSNFQYAYAWVKEGPAINLTERYGADRHAYAVSFDGHRVALNLVDRDTYQGRGVALWDHARGLTPIGALQWCKDVPYVELVRRRPVRVHDRRGDRGERRQAADGDLRHERRRLGADRSLRLVLHRLRRARCGSSRSAG